MVITSKEEAALAPAPGDALRLDIGTLVVHHLTIDVPARIVLRSAPAGDVEMTITQEKWSSLVSRFYLGRWPVEGTTFTARSSETPREYRYPQTFRVVYGPHGWHAVCCANQLLGANRTGELLLAFPDATGIILPSVLS